MIDEFLEHAPSGQPIQRSIVTVIGMHRSGTSAIAKGLECLGLNMGDALIAPGEDNPRGYWEDAEVLRINKEVLERLNIAWNDTRIVPEALFLGTALKDLHDQAEKLLINRADQYTMWGFKDPRTLRVLPFWLHAAEQSGVNLQFVVALRHPYAVALSLQKRNGISLTRGQLMWAAYTLPFLPHIKNYPHVFISYDDLLEQPALVLEKISLHLELSIDDNKLKIYVEQFLSQSLRHHSVALNDEEYAKNMLPLLDKIYHILTAIKQNESVAQWVLWAACYEEYQRYQSILEELDAESDYHWKRRGSFLKRLIYG